MKTKSTIAIKDFETERHSIDRSVNDYRQEARYEELVWRLLFGASCLSGLSGVESIGDGKRDK